MFCFIGREACGILASQPGMEPKPPALEGKLLTTGLPGKSLLRVVYSVKMSFRNTGKIKTFSDIEKLKELITSRNALQKMLTYKENYIRWN